MILEGTVLEGEAEGSEIREDEACPDRLNGQESEQVNQQQALALVQPAPASVAGRA